VETESSGKNEFKGLIGFSGGVLHKNVPNNPILAKDAPRNRFQVV
jgi:hypothetical protein